MKFKAASAIFAAISLLTVAVLPARAETIEIVALGDSLTAGYELPAEEAFPARLEVLLREKGHDVTIANAGVSGDTSSDGLARLDWSIPDGTDGVILELGANDALRGLTPEETRKNIEAIVVRLKERNIPVLLAGMLAPPNMGSDYEARFNALFPDIAKAHGLVYYPFFLDGVALDASLQLADGMHPNGKGTRVMAERFLPAMEQFLATLASGK